MPGGRNHSVSPVRFFFGDSCMRVTKPAGVGSTDDGHDAVNQPPQGAPSWITADLIRLTKKIFEPLYQRALSAAEASTMLANVGRLFETLSRR